MGSMTNDCSGHRRQLPGLQVLRTVACAGVFLTHTLIDGLDALGSSAVTIFFMLSGFVLVYQYLGRHRLAEPSLVANVRFAVHKLWRLYPLHVAMICLMVVIMRIPPNQLHPEDIAAIPASMLLVQSWVPVRSTFWGTNSVSWFLSDLLFLYFLFPWILRAFERLPELSLRQARRRAMAVITVMLAVEVIFGLLSTCFPHPVGGETLGFWFMYIFPPARIPDFMIGCVLGYVFVRTQESPHESVRDEYMQSSMMQLFAVVLMMLANLLFEIAHHGKDDWVGYRIMHDGVWYSELLPFTMTAGLLIWSFAYTQGAMTQMLDNRVMMFLAALSPYFYLIHRPAMLAVQVAIAKCGVGILIDSMPYMAIVIAVSLALSWLYSAIIGRPVRWQSRDSANIRR